MKINTIESLKERIKFNQAEFSKLNLNSNFHKARALRLKMQINEDINLLKKFESEIHNSKSNLHNWGGLLKNIFSYLFK